MKKVDIIESIADHVEQKILKEWKHEGSVEVIYTDRLDVEIDGTFYVISIAATEAE